MHRCKLDPTQLCRLPQCKFGEFTLGVNVLPAITTCPCASYCSDESQTTTAHLNCIHCSLCMLLLTQELHAGQYILLALAYYQLRCQKPVDPCAGLAFSKDETNTVSPTLTTACHQCEGKYRTSPGPMLHSSNRDLSCPVSEG